MFSHSILYLVCEVFQGSSYSKFTNNKFAENIGHFLFQGKRKAGRRQVQDTEGGEEGQHQEEDRQLREHVEESVI